MAASSTHPTAVITNPLTHLTSLLTHPLQLANQNPHVLTHACPSVFACGCVSVGPVVCGDGLCVGVCVCVCVLLCLCCFVWVCIEERSLCVCVCVCVCV